MAPARPSPCGTVRERSRTAGACAWLGLIKASRAAKEATKDIPIVMGAVGDPVGTGLVTSLARPGGNVTGVSTAGAEVAGKSLELIRELFPSARRVAVLARARI